MTTKPTDQQRLIHALWHWVQAHSWPVRTEQLAEWIPEDLHDELGNAIITVDEWLRTQTGSGL